MLLATLALHFAVQASTPPQQDTALKAARKRPPVTEAVAASAFDSPDARAVFARARNARTQQDSALRSYDARVHQRLSVSASVGRFGPERVVYRQESASRVRWQRGIGAHVDMTGVRVAIPVAGSTQAERDAVKETAADIGMSPIPYFPGSETLWIGAAARTEVDERNFIHPLANGAEEFYTYRAGDSASYRLPDGSSIQLRELLVRPRAARPNLVVGSLWFDTKSGQLVRAVYRLSAPAGAVVSVSDPDDSTAKPPRLAKLLITALMPSTKADISSITVEYGLFNGQFWLPRNQAMEGSMTASFLRVPVRFEDSFDYASVNAPLGLAAIVVDTTVNDRAPGLRRPPKGLDEAARQKWRDSTRVVYDAQVKARKDSIAAGMQVGTMRQCDLGRTRVITQNRYDGSVPVEVRIPCNVDSLMTSPDFTGSIYDTNEEVFGATDRDALVAGALGLAAQAPFSLTELSLPRLQFGLSMTRFNRVEGFSTGLLAEQQLGGGYSATAQGRYGFGDHVWNGELSLARSNATRTIRLGAYKRLVASNDWGNPLSFNSSLSAFFLARDDGFYYRARGAELAWTSERGTRLEWRAFTEQQDIARPSRLHTIGGNFSPNILAPSLTETGASVRYLNDFGLDPRGLRAFTDLRVEGAGGDSVYGRVALDLTLSRGFGRQAQGAITLASGTSVGGLPIQRYWFLGGVHTIRGEIPSATQSGNAFWFTRTELARAYEGYRMALFGDLGWVGDRTKIAEVGRPISGVGVGMSMFDGFVRVDLARGLHPDKITLLYLYLGARF